MPRMPITWVCGLDPSGYSSCARSYLMALRDNPNAEVYLKPVEIARNINGLGIHPEEMRALLELVPDAYPPGVTVQHSVPDRFVMGPGRRVGYTVVETDPIPRWVFICNQFDTIMTASEFCREKLVDGGVRSEIVHVVPHCHDVRIWNPSVRPLNIANLKPFNFLFVGDYTPRKGGDILLRAFARAFAGNKDVSLTVKAYFNSFAPNDQVKLEREIRETLQETGISKSDLPAVFFYGDPIDEVLMPRFMSSFNCLVSPHRCEGWGLSISQMQCLGKPVIATRYSGNLEFMDDASSYLFDVAKMEPVGDRMREINPNLGGLWALPDEESLSETMLHVFANQAEAQKKGELAAVRMAEKYSYEVVSDMILSVLGGA